MQTKVAINIPKVTRKITNEDILLLRMCENIKEIPLESGSIELLDLHIHPDGIGRSIDYHEHSFIEIHTIDSGAGKIHVGDKSYKFSKGQFTITKPNIVHHWEMTEGPLLMHIWWLGLRLKDDLQGDESESPLVFFKNPQKVVYNIPAEYDFLYSAILTELKKQNICYEDCIKDYLSLLIKLFARAMIKGKNLKSKRPLKEKASEDRIVNIIDQYINDNISLKISTKDISKFISRSVRSISRHYRNVTGLSIGEKIDQVKMYKAEELLRETDLQIKAIAYQVGYDDVRYFARRFKKFFNYSASDYRNKIFFIDGVKRYVEPEKIK